ncbi:MAG: RNA polymerase subunit sigma-70, partial [Planctomycetaceae bacterium]|nr:RNA polymerase subunit sigma-70 [Planctomycetaceae bacterium]
MPYKIRPIKELQAQQARYAPREKKIEQMERAEKFFNEIDTEKNYSYKSICFHITEYRPEMHAELVFPGKDVKSDLLLFIDDLAKSIAIPLEQARESVWTIE